MCFNASNKTEKEDHKQLEHDYVVQWKEEDRASYGFYCVSGFDHPLMPVITSDGQITNKHWGLIPHWAKDWNQAKDLQNMTLNAQSETIDSKPSFRQAVKENRFCIIPLTGYFEWHHHSNHKKYPYYIYPSKDKFFYVAGLHEQWKNPVTNTMHQSFTMCTTPANERLAWIHNSKKRMPCLLTLEESKLWLDTGLSFNEKQSLLRPASEELHKDYTIGRLINETPELKNQAQVLQPYTYPELGFGTLFD